MTNSNVFKLSSYALGRVVVLLSLCMGFVTSPVVQSAVEDRKLTMSLNSDIRSTNPGVRRDNNTDVVVHHMVEALLAVDANMKAKPLLAESFDVSEEGKVYTFKLRKGLKFHNGEPVTANEVMWSWKRYLNPNTSWKCRSWYTRSLEQPELNASRSIIEKIEAPTPYEIVFKLAYASRVFPARIASAQCVTAILHPNSVDADGKWIAPIGTGPYKLKKWKHGDYVELERFDEYQALPGPADGLVGGRYALADTVRFVVNPDPASAKAALLAGDIDVYPKLLMNAVAEMEAEPKVKVQHKTTQGWMVLLMNTKDVFFKNKKMRQALAYALDRVQLSGFISYGYAKVNSSFIPVSNTLHSKVHDQWYEPNIAKARQLLKEAGYRGEVLKLQTTRKHADQFELALVVQAMLQNAGLNVRLEVLDWASQLGNYYSGKFQFMSFAYSGVADPVFRLMKLIGDKTHIKTRQWDDPRAIALAEEIIASANSAERQQLYDTLYLLMKEEVPIIGVYNSHSAHTVGVDVEGYSSWALGKFRLWGVYKKSWGLPDELIAKAEGR